MTKIYENFEDFVFNELNKEIDIELVDERVEVKRKYTDKYPSKSINAKARVRSAVLSAMKDGIVTEEELDNIIAAAQGSKAWKRKNTKLFKVTEDGIKLSKFGSRIYRRTLVTEEK